MFSLETISAINDQAVKSAKSSARLAVRELRRKPFVPRIVNLSGRLIHPKHKTVFQTAQDGIITV
jgi:pantoate kinase